MILTRSCQLESVDLAGHQFTYHCAKSRSFDSELKRSGKRDVKYRGMAIIRESLSRNKRPNPAGSSVTERTEIDFRVTQTSDLSVRVEQQPADTNDGLTSTISEGDLGGSAANAGLRSCWHNIFQCMTNQLTFFSSFQRASLLRRVLAVTPSSAAALVLFPRHRSMRDIITNR